MRCAPVYREYGGLVFAVAFKLLGDRGWLNRRRSRPSWLLGGHQNRLTSGETWRPGWAP